MGIWADISFSFFRATSFGIRWCKIVLKVKVKQTEVGELGIIPMGCLMTTENSDKCTRKEAL